MAFLIIYAQSYGGTNSTGLKFRKFSLKGRVHFELLGYSIGGHCEVPHPSQEE